MTVIEDGGSALSPSAETLTATSEWLTGCRRDLAPSELAFKIGDLRFGSNVWCQASEINRRATARPGDKDYPSIRASVDRASNTIDLETVNVLGVSLFLSDALLDLDQPVIVTVNGEERHKRLVVRSLRFLMENRYYNNSGDYGLYTGRVNIDEIAPNVPGRDQ